MNRLFVIALSLCLGACTPQVSTAGALTGGEVAFESRFTGLTQPTDLRFLPDGRALATEQAGRVVLLAAGAAPRVVLDLRERPLTDRRAALEHVLGAHPFPSSTLRLSEQVAGDGRSLHARAKAQGWEGLLVKQARSPYRSGRRSPEWRKLKLQHVDEFVVCGYTEPQGTRARFGALILGVYPRLVTDVTAGSVGHLVDTWRLATGG